MDKTPRELILGIVLEHGPISGTDIVQRCCDLGYVNKRSTAAQMFNMGGRLSKTLVQGTATWSIAPQSPVQGTPA